MTYSRTPSDQRTSSAFLSYVSQSELRRSQSFAAVQPPEKLDLATTPTPWSHEAYRSEPLVVERTSKDDVVHRALPRDAYSNSRTSLPAKPLVETDFDIESRVNEDDPPFQTPGSWLKPPKPETGVGLLSFGKNWNWSERSTAAFLGFAAGIFIVVPIVIFLSLTADPNPAPPATMMVEKERTQPATTKVAMAGNGISAGTWFDSGTTRAPARSSTSSPAIEVVSQAHQAITEGRLAHARSILRDAASPEAPRLWFMLAETYDPKIFGRTTRHASGSTQLQVADANFARFYYQQALTHGISEAQARLDGLTNR